MVATTGAHYATPAAGQARPPRWPRCGRGAAWTRPTRTCRPGPGRTCGPGRRWRRCSPATRRRCRRPPRIGEECSFDLHLVAPKLPPYDVPPGHDENSWLRRAHHDAAPPGGTDRRTSRPDAYAQIEKELRIIAELELPRLFPDRARHRRVLPRPRHPLPGQGFGGELRGLLRAGHHRGGRGAATSCCSSGSWRRNGTARRTSTSTSSPTGGRRSSSTSTTRTAATHAAQVANVNTFRPRMAVRDMAKALGHSPGQQDAYSKQLDGWSPLAARSDADGTDHRAPHSGRRARTGRRRSRTSRGIWASTPAAW